jgi:hypothetical protein
MRKRFSATLQAHFLPSSQLQSYHTNSIYFNNNFANYSLPDTILFASSFTAYTWFPSQANLFKQSNKVCWNDAFDLPLNLLEMKRRLPVLRDPLTGSVRCPVLSGVVRNTTVKESFHKSTTSIVSYT